MLFFSIVGDGEVFESDMEDVQNEDNLYNVFLQTRHGSKCFLLQGGTPS